MLSWANFRVRSHLTKENAKTNLKQIGTVTVNADMTEVIFLSPSFSLSLHEALNGHN